MKTDKPTPAPPVDLRRLARHYRVNLREVALQSLDKKVLRELCAALGMEVTTTRDRSREAMANRLAHFADEMSIAVTWDERMPNDVRVSDREGGAS